MKDHTEYTAAEDINDVRQLVALIKARPCINPRGTGVNRAVAIGYAELAVIERRLAHALSILSAGDFVRPMGATPTDGPDDLKIVKRLSEKMMSASQLASEMNENPFKMLGYLLTLRELGMVAVKTPGEAVTVRSLWGAA